MIETATSSSVASNDLTKYSPEFSVDGLISNTDTGFFKTKREKYSWLDPHLATPKRLIGIKITSRMDVYKEGIEKMEIRAGRRWDITRDQRRRGETFTTMFDKSVLAENVSIQLTYLLQGLSYGRLWDNEAILIKGAKTKVFKAKI